MRKLKVFASLIWASLPLFVAAQSNDAHNMQIQELTAIPA